MADSAPIQIDYTSRDYASLRQDLIARVQERLPNWLASDGADFGVALVESFAYLGDLLSYYVDRAANESTLSTATRRESVVALAADLGYRPYGYQAASVVVGFANSSEADITIPAGTVVSASLADGDAIISVPFEVDSTIDVPAGTFVEVFATQGTTVVSTSGFGEYLGLSDGTPSQRFTLSSDRVVMGSVQVYVFDGVNYIPWNAVDYFSDYGPLDRVYRVNDPGTGEVTLDFGDGVSGLIPAQSQIIYAAYRSCEGLLGNVPAGAIDSLDSIPDLTSNEVAVIAGYVTVTNNAAAYGGNDPQSTESIRTLAPLTYRTANRAVTLEDFQNIALSVSGSGKASASLDAPYSVVVAVAPYRSVSGAEARPGYSEEATGWEETDELLDLKDRVLSRLQETSLAGVNVQVVAPTYVDVFMELEVELNSGVRQSDASILIEQSILSRFDYNLVPFGAEIYASDLVALVSSLGNVAKDVAITRLNIVSNVDPSVGTIQAAEDELLIVAASNVNVVLTGGIEDA